MDDIKHIASSTKSVLLLHEAMKLCETYGVPVAKYGVADTLEHAVDQASRIGYPVVLKLISPYVAHKFDVGAVILNIKDERELRDSYVRIYENLRKHLSSARVYGVLVQEMVPTSIEVIVGFKRDRYFGPIVMFGLGGIFTEVLKDVSFRMYPISREDAFEIITELKGYPIMMGYRGIPPVDVDVIVDILLRVSKMVMDIPSISEMDLNPIAVSGKDVKVLDARVLLSTT